MNNSSFDNDLKKVRHPLVSAIGGVSAALEYLPSDPKLSERLLKLALEKLSTILDQTEKIGKKGE